MSTGWIPSAAATAAIIAAAQKKKKQQKEEENMSGYSKEDLDGWEFKIMRSDFGRFRNSKYVQKICQEEARAGWELVEKFDDSRLRFKRRVEKRSYDQHLDIDPYRTTVSGGGSSALIMVIIGILVALGGVFLLIGRSLPRIDQMPWLIILLIVGLLVVMIALKRSRR
jgi:hypothetical protein